jgi:hypothetical protein
MASHFIFGRYGRVIGLVGSVIFAVSTIWRLTPAFATPAASLTVNATTGTVNPGDPCPNPRNSAIYKTIQKAVDCAIAGDTIAVAAGTFNENVLVSKSVGLFGANAGVDARNPRGTESIVNGGGVSAPIGIGASGVVVDGFKLSAGQNGLGAGVWIGGGVTDTQVLNNVITDNTIGLAVIGACPCTVRHNLFAANNRTGAAGGKALYVENTNGLVFDSNTVTGHTNDIPIVFASTPPTSLHYNVTFSGNAVYGNTYNGAYLLSVNGGTITANNFVGNGLFFEGGNHNINVTTNNFSYGNPAVAIDLRRDGYPYGSNSGININFNRFIANSPYAIHLVRNYVGTLNAEHNWWGCNYGPGASGPGCTVAANGNSGASIDANPWLILRIFTSRPSVSQNGGQVAVSANLRGTSAGSDTTGLGQVPDSIPAFFTSTLGVVTPTQAGTVSGRALSTFIAGPTLGTAVITTTVDNQRVSLPLTITPNYLYLPAILKE